MTDNRLSWKPNLEIPTAVSKDESGNLVGAMRSYDNKKIPSTINPQIGSFSPYELGVVHLTNSIIKMAEQIEGGYNRIRDMYTVLFYFGIALITASLFISVFSDNTFLAVVTSIAGGANVITLLAYRPAKELEKSRANLAQMVMLIVSWYDSISKWSEVHDKFHKGQPIDLDTYKKIAQAQSDFINKIDKYIEKDLRKKLDEIAKKMKAQGTQDLEEK